MNRSVPWAPSVFLFLLAAAPVLACPHLVRSRYLIVESFAAPSQPPTAPAQPPTANPLVPPKDQVLLFTFRAEGVQIYECRARKNKPDEFEWVLKAPDATLYDDRGEKAGTHGAGPTWEATDGSKVVGVKMASADAPGGRAVLWLLLRAQSHEGKGAFSKVTYIQRVDTWAGLPPAAGATKENAGKMVRVKYEATYRFYGPAQEPKSEDNPEGFSKELRKAVNHMADLAAKGKDDEVKKLAEMFARDYAKDEEGYSRVKQGLRLRKKGGFGIGTRAGAYDPDGIELYMYRQTRPNSKPLTPAELKATADDLERVADVLQVMAELTRQYTPKEMKRFQDPKDWTKWTEEMRQGAVDLKAAVKAEKPNEVRQAFLTLRGSCEACHATFRD